MNKNTSENQLLDLLKKLGINVEKPTRTELLGAIEEKKEIKCKGCSKTLSEIKIINHLNCDLCYETFGSIVLNYLEKNYGNKNAKKKDKIKTSSTKSKTLEQFIKKLEISLNQAIETENYEEAATLRDRISGLKEILIEVKKIREKIKDCIKQEKFDEAMDIKKNLEALIKTCMIN